MNISELINEIISEWAYRVNDGMPDAKNPTHLKELSIVLKEMGLSHIKDTLIENLLTEKGKTPEEIEEADKNFTNPILNKKVNYKAKDGTDKEGIVGNLLRQPEGTPARDAAEKMLPPEGSPEREELNQELGGENQPKKPEDGKAGAGGEEGGAPKEDPIKKAAPMFDPKVDPAMGARLDKEKELQAQFAQDAKKAQDDFKAQSDKAQADFKAQSDKAQSDFKAQAGDKVEKAKAKGYDFYKLSLDDNELKAEEDKERQAVADAKASGDEKGAAANSLKYYQTKIAKAKKSGDKEEEQMWSDEYTSKRADYEKQYGKPEDEFDLSKDKAKSNETEFNPIDVKDVAKEMPQADPETFNGSSDIPDAIDPKELEQFNTDINKVAQQVADAKAKGEPAPNINLCDVTVPGTNLYCDDNLGIPRDEMPQFKGNASPGSRAAGMEADASGEVDTEPVFREMLKQKGIKTLQTEVPADKLKATQKDLVGAKVVGMMGALEKDPNHPKITAPIYVSRDGYVIDGHHRWAAVVAYNAQNPDKQIQMKTTVLDQDIKDAIPMANKFAEDMGIAAKKADANKEAPSTPSSVGKNGLTDKIKQKIENWTKEERAFFEKNEGAPGSEMRRSLGQTLKDKAAGAWKAIKKGAKHEVEEFKAAGSGVKNFFSGKELSEHEVKAVKAVGFKIVTTALFGAATGGIAHGAAAFGKHVAMEFIPHVIGETILKGAGRAALFADMEGEAEMDANMEKFAEIIAKGLEEMEITPEMMEQMVDSYNKKKEENPQKEMTEENLQLAHELMLEMIYGFIDEATTKSGKFAARSKQTNKLVYFDTPEAQKDAVKAGTHTDPEAKTKTNEPVAGADLFKDKESQKRLGKEKNADSKKEKIVKYKQYNSESGIVDMEGPDGSSFEGYKDGKIKAPGTPAGAFNEVGGMKVAGYLRQNPNATDEELSNYLSEWANGGKITKKPKVSGGDKLTAAVRTGRAVYERCNEIASEEGYDPTTTKISGYWGSEQSKANSIAQIQNIAKQNPKAKFNGYGVDEYIKIIEKNGAGENPTDVMLTIWDGKSDNVALFHVSNKIGSNNIQANSTVRKTYDRAESIINNVFTDETQKQAAMKSVEKRKGNTLKLQKSQIEYQISFLGKFAAISKNEKALASLAKDIYNEEGSIRRGDEINKMFTSTGAIGKLCKKLAKPHPSCKLVDNAKATPSQKVKAMFDVYAANPNSAPSPVREIISRASTMKADSGKPKYNTGYNAEVINEIYGKMNDEVESMRKDLNKIQAGSGDRLLAKDFADRLHLTLAEGHNPGGIPANRFSLVMGNNEADIWYDANGQAYQKIKNAYHKVNDDGNLDKNPTPLKQNQVNRGNISTIGDSKNFKHCLNTPKGKKIEESINVKYGKINTKTGIQTAHIFDIDGKPVGIMTIRTKSGPGGDANDTIQFSKEMQNCMQKQEYLKKKNK